MPLSISPRGGEDWLRDNGLRFWLRFWLWLWLWFRFWFRNRLWFRFWFWLGFGNRFRFRLRLRFGWSEIYEIFLLPLNHSEGEGLSIKRINCMCTSNLQRVV